MSEVQRQLMVTGNNKGFSIIETLIAAAIFSIGFLAISAVLWSSTCNLRTTFFCDRAVLAGQQAMEIMSARDLQQVAAPEKPVEINGQMLEWDVCESEDVNKNGLDDFKTVELEVYQSEDGELSKDKLRMLSVYRLRGK